MPVIIKYKCEKCKGETDVQGVECVNCLFKGAMKVAGHKHCIHFYDKKKE